MNRPSVYAALRNELPAPEGNIAYGGGEATDCGHSRATKSCARARPTREVRARPKNGRATIYRRSTPRRTSRPSTNNFAVQYMERNPEGDPERPAAKSQAARQGAGEPKRRSLSNKSTAAGLDCLVTRILVAILLRCRVTSIVLVRFMTADCASCDCSEEAVMSDIMSGDTAYNRAFDASARLRGIRHSKQ